MPEAGTQHSVGPCHPHPPASQPSPAHVRAAERFPLGSGSGTRGCSPAVSDVCWGCLREDISSLAPGKKQQAESCVGRVFFFPFSFCHSTNKSVPAASSFSLKAPSREGILKSCIFVYNVVLYRGCYYITPPPHDFHTKGYPALPGATLFSFSVAFVLSQGPESSESNCKQLC